MPRTRPCRAWLCGSHWATPRALRVPHQSLGQRLQRGDEETTEQFARLPVPLPAPRHCSIARKVSKSAPPQLRSVPTRSIKRGCRPLCLRTAATKTLKRPTRVAKSVDAAGLKPVAHSLRVRIPPRVPTHRAQVHAQTASWATPGRPALVDVSEESGHGDPRLRLLGDRHRHVPAAIRVHRHRARSSRGSGVGQSRYLVLPPESCPEGSRARG